MGWKTHKTFTRVCEHCGNVVPPGYIYERVQMLRGSATVHWCGSTCYEAWHEGHPISDPILESPRVTPA
jgi:hypothetical protein